MRRLLGALLAVAFLAGGCQGQRAVQHTGIDVDNAELRAVRQQARIAPCTPATGASAAPRGLPDVTLPCLGGGEDVELARLRGPMVVNLFAQWCKPCRTEMPHYQAFHEKYGAKVPVLGIDWQDTQPLNALRLARSTGVTYPLVADTQPLIKARGLPRLVLLDEHGNIAYDQYVEITSVRQLEDLVAQHLGVRP